MIKNGLGKLRSELRFLLEHKWSVVKPADDFAISKALLKKYLPENAVIVDCGAHIGMDSIQLARLFPLGRVHCFEPVPAVFAQLRQNIKKIKNISCYNLALGDMDGTRAMHISSGASDGSSSLLLPTGHLEKHPDVHFTSQAKVSINKLDTWAKDNSIEHVDFLWLDMQGSEYEMLNASAVVFPNVSAIYTEVSIQETYKNAMLYPELNSWLMQRGFSRIKEFIPAGADMGNVLYVRNANH
jgi:FkbM family methyltransferase